MNNGGIQTFESSKKLPQAPLAAEKVRASVVSVSNCLPERDALARWARAEGIPLSIESSWGVAMLASKDERTALRVVDWADLERYSDRTLLAACAPSPVLVIVAEADRPDLTRLPPEARMDILCRPYPIEELFWRVSRAIGATSLRESTPSIAGCARIEVGPIVFDEERGDVLVGGEPLNLRRTECAVLVYLMRNTERFVSSRELQSEVLDSHGSGSAARNQVYEVRLKLRAFGFPKAILHEPRKGYRLNWEG